MMNANNPQTPGVYTVEKNAFPTSVAQVPTAIPAFIGYTEKAEQNGKSLINTPTLINSLSEYDQYFGGAPESKFPILPVQKPANEGTPAEGSYDFTLSGKFYKIGTAKGGLFYLFNSLRMFYLNGGGPAYIVSVGTYLESSLNDKGTTATLAAVVKQDKLLGGLNLLPKIEFPKPTMILIPDAMALDNKESCYILQQQMIAQAGELKDRVVLLDIYQGWLAPDDPADVIGNFRKNMGASFLSYAIAYYPWLRCSVVETSEISYVNVYQPKDNETTATDPINIKDILVDQPLIPKLDQLAKDLSSLKEQLFIPPSLTLADTNSSMPFPTWSAAFNGSSATDSNKILNDKAAVLTAMYQLIYDLGNGGMSPGIGTATITIKSKELIQAIAAISNAKGTIAGMMASLSTYESKFPGGGAGNMIFKGLKSWQITAPASDPYSSIDSTQDEATKQTAAFNLADPVYKNAFDQLYKALNSIINTASNLFTQHNQTLENSNADYKNIMSAIAKQANILPPSGAMAGIYTSVDNTEGVWQAPANRNINAVVAPMVTINDDQQASLNVDALAGKSINAVRSFHGRGSAIIWGARTMDGNSQDWRYINVRRLLIMIEQSVANAVFSLVFEPNDATTWTTCESMISNFLHNLWSEGGLQGASPADAYAVSVGLGKTMTHQDILDGIMRVQVKVAVTHPVEFIIIIYEQEMTKS